MTILERIVETKRSEVAAAKERRPLAEVQADAARLAPPRDFFGAVTAATPRGVQLIAEVKKASPSAGVIVPDFDPAAIVRAYAAHGAAAISVLTDETYFHGRLDDLLIVKRAVPLPVLRKDFIVDEYQLFESRAASADAVLLIVEVLGPRRVAELLPVSNSLGLTTLIEVHDAENLSALLEVVGPPAMNHYLLGINNRDLHAQRTDPSTTIRLAAMLPRTAPFVSESGLATRQNVAAVRQAGACAILVGESLLKAKDVGRQIAELLGDRTTG